FPDIAREAGLTDTFYCGSDEVKKYIIESLGGGGALFDYNNDGYPDAFFVTAARLEGFPGKEPVNQLYRNNRDGTFTRLTRQAGFVHCELHRFRKGPDASAGRRAGLQVEGDACAVRPARTAGRNQPAIPQPRRRQVPERVRRFRSSQARRTVLAFSDAARFR